MYAPQSRGDWVIWDKGLRRVMNEKERSTTLHSICIDTFLTCKRPVKLLLRLSHILILQQFPIAERSTRAVLQSSVTGRLPRCSSPDRLFEVDILSADPR